MNKIDTNTLEGKIAVMEASKTREVQSRPWNEETWYPILGDPMWNWHKSDYRIKPLEFPKLPDGLEYFNPSGVTLNDVGEGYRPLVRGELIPSGAEYWGDNGWAKTAHAPGCVSVNSFTYRTSISTPFPEPPKPKVMVPLQEHDLTPECVIRQKNHRAFDWVRPEGVSYSGVHIPVICLYDRLIPWEKLMISFEYSRDGGKTWHPCEKESES